MVERVMILDTVLGDRRCWWLSPDADKQRFFGLKRESWLQPEDYPHIAFGSGRQRTIRCFPDKLPIGIEKDHPDRVVFLYLMNRRLPVEDAIRLLDGRQSGLESVEKFGEILDTREAADGSI
jgi:hypothetical protein